MTYGTTGGPQKDGVGGNKQLIFMYFDKLLVQVNGLLPVRPLLKSFLIAKVCAGNGQ